MTWNHTDIYIARCLRPFRTHAEGREHELYCEHCQRIKRGEPEPEESNESEDHVSENDRD